MENNNVTNNRNCPKMSSFQLRKPNTREVKNSNTSMFDDFLGAQEAKAMELFDDSHLAWEEAFNVAVRDWNIAVETLTLAHEQSQASAFLDSSRPRPPSATRIPIITLSKPREEYTPIVSTAPSRPSHASSRTASPMPGRISFTSTSSSMVSASAVPALALQASVEKQQPSRSTSSLSVPGQEPEVAKRVSGYGSQAQLLAAADEAVLPPATAAAATPTLAVASAAGAEPGAAMSLEYAAVAADLVAASASRSATAAPPLEAVPLGPQKRASSLALDSNYQNQLHRSSSGGGGARPAVTVIPSEVEESPAAPSTPLPRQRSTGSSAGGGVADSRSQPPPAPSVAVDPVVEAFQGAEEPSYRPDERTAAVKAAVAKAVEEGVLVQRIGDEELQQVLHGLDDGVKRVLYPPEVVDALDNANAERLEEIRTEWETTVEQTEERNGGGQLLIMAR